jgi:Spy/CpxP family protein refolding chaperone
MTKTKLLTVAVVTLLLINIATLAFVFMRKPPIHDGMRHGEGPKQIIIDRLHFNEQQQKQYDIFVEDHRTKSKGLNSLSREMHNALYALLKEKSVDKQIADSLITQIAEHQKAIDNLNLNHFRQIKSICKDDQITLFNTLVNDLTHLFSPPPPKK